MRPHAPASPPLLLHAAPLVCRPCRPVRRLHRPVHRLRHPSVRRRPSASPPTPPRPSPPTPPPPVTSPPAPTCAAQSADSAARLDSTKRLGVGLAEKVGSWTWTRSGNDLVRCHGHSRMEERGPPLAAMLCTPRRPVQRVYLAIHLLTQEGLLPHGCRCMSRMKEKDVMILKARCLFCKKLYSYTQGGCPSHLGRHKRACATYKSVMAKKDNQALLNFAPSSAGDSRIPVVHSPSEYSHEQTQKLLTNMIIVHEYLFRMVEYTWFNILMKYLNPSYQFIGRKIIRSECLKIFDSEREILMKSLKGVNNIALTTDLWTSNQTLAYMCLVAHYVDKDWNMQCRVLNFIELDPPHTGHVISQAIFECVAAWKIEDKIISITLDNVSNNDVAVRALKAKFAARGSHCFIAKYFHVRCCAHIIKLVVNDGITSISHLITNVRKSVKYIKKSPSRLHKFVEICRSLALIIGEGLKLDMSTTCNSTYYMLKTCIAYKEALVSYADSDANYRWEPTWEWAMFQTIQPILASLAEVTTTFSASTYPTSNIFYPRIINIKIALRAACASSNEYLKTMGTAMMEKFNKYWEEKNNVMVIATILDPRYKLKYIEWGFKKIYESQKAMVEYEDVKNELEKLYEKYEMDHRHEKAAFQKSGASSSSIVDTSSSLPSSSSEF